MARLDGMLSILWLLKSNERMTAEKIAESLELSVRTVYRYMDLLGVSGVPIISEPGHGGGFKLPESFSSFPLFFEMTELKAMAHSAELARQAEYPYSDALERALKKIEIRLHASQLEDLRRHSSDLQIMEISRNSPIQQTLRALEQAVAERTTVSVTYAKSERSTPQERLLDPYGLIYRLNRWYIVANCHLRQTVRVFRVDRIVGISIPGQTFTRPDQFSVKDYFERLMQDQEPEGDIVTVHLQGQEDLLDQICNQWFLQSSVVERRDGEAWFTLHEGTCVQMMHIGPYSTEPDTIKKIHLFMKHHALIQDGLHHEIYLSDPRKVKPSSMKTILRFPVKHQ